jgi:predicted acyl esterase
VTGYRLSSRLAAIWVAAIALTALPATAAGQQPDPVSETVPFQVAAADGTALRGYVFLPHRAPRRLATVLELSPYFYTGATNRARDELRTRHSVLLKAGFAVALVNVRGTGRSDGCFGFLARREWADTYAIVEALADRRWSNGKVGMVGISFSAGTQYAAVAEAPPSLKAVVPESSMLDLWSILARRGAPIHIGPFGGQRVMAENSFAALPPNPSHLCSDEAASLNAAIAELVRTGDRGAYFEARDFRPFLRDTDIPMLVSNGLAYFTEGHLTQIEGLWDLLRPDRTRFMLGQWGHDSPAGHRDDWHELVVAWFDRFLRGGGREPARTGVVEYQDTSGQWHTADRWPPPAERSTLRLSGESLVEDGRHVEESRRSFQTADVDPAWSCGPHQALYASPPLADDVVLAGNFDARLTVTDPLPGGNLVAVLRAVPASATCAHMTAESGSALARHVTAPSTPWHEIGRLQMDLRHWREPGRSHEFPVQQPTVVSAASQPLAAFVPAGHRLVLGIGGGSIELEPDPLRPRLAITTGPGHEGSISLPVAKGRAGVPAMSSRTINTRVVLSGFVVLAAILLGGTGTAVAQTTGVGTHIERGYIAMVDGTKLHYHVEFPETGKRLPAMLNYTYYAPGVPVTGTGDGSGMSRNELLKRGYALVGVTVRGVGCSEGTFDQIFDPHWSADGYEVVEWIARQPWSNGKVGMYGLSGPGILQWMVAGAQPPHLTAIVPFSTLGDVYRDVGAPGGIKNIAFAAIFMGAQNGLAALNQVANPGDPPC